jgi:hypothetical protein
MSRSELKAIEVSSAISISAFNETLLIDLSDEMLSNLDSKSKLLVKSRLTGDYPNGPVAGSLVCKLIVDLRVEISCCGSLQVLLMSCYDAPDKGILRAQYMHKHHPMRLRTTI